MRRDFPFTTSRRDLMQLAGGMTLASLGLPLRLLAQEATNAGAATPAIDPFHRFPRMVHDYYLAKVRAVEKQGILRKAALSSKAEAEAYINDVRERIAKAFAPMPEKKTPLNAKVTGILDRDAYTLEKDVCECRPKL